MEDSETSEMVETPPTLTDEQRVRMEEWLAAHPYGEQDENGIDLSLLRRNLRLTPTERIQQNHAFIRSLHALRPFAHSVLDAERLLTALVSAKVPFVLIGSLAMCAQGCAHAADDMDVALHLTDPTAERIFTALSSLNIRLRSHRSAYLALDTDAGPLDIFREWVGDQRLSTICQRADTLELFGVPVQVARVEDLIAMKQTINRLGKGNHLLELEALKKLKIEDGIAPAIPHGQIGTGTVEKPGSVVDC